MLSFSFSVKNLPRWVRVWVMSLRLGVGDRCVGMGEMGGGAIDRRFGFTLLGSPIAVYFWMHEASLERVWTLRAHPTNSHPLVLAVKSAHREDDTPNPQLTRKPTLLLRLSRVLLLRLAERQFTGLLFHEPPRSSLVARPSFTVRDGEGLDLRRFVVVSAKCHRGQDGHSSFVGFGRRHDR